MKSTKILILVALLFTGFNSFAREGYVDIRRAFSNTKRGKKVDAQLNRRVAKIRKQIRSKETQLKKEQAKLEKEMPLLSEQERARKIQNLQQKFLESKKQIEKKQIALQQLEGKLRGPVLKQLNQVISRVAKNEGYTVIYDKGPNILWVQGSVDLTSKVTKLFNKKFK